MYVTNCCLTNAYSDPDVRQVISLCADQKLAAPVSVKLKISSRKFIKCSLSCSYPALNACITLSFSSLVLSPLSFSMWAGVRYWRFRDLALHWAQDAAHEMHGGLNIHSDIHYNFYRGYLLCPFAIQRFAFWDCRYCQQEEGRSMSTPCQCSCRNSSSAIWYYLSISCSLYHSIMQMAHQMSTFLGIRLHCWKMFGLSQLLDNTNTSSLSMPRLTLIRSRLSVLRVAELSMKGTPWYVARNQRQSSGEYGLKLQPRSGSATFEETYCKNNLFQQKNLTCASSTAI